MNGNNDGKNIAYTHLGLGLHMDLMFVFFFSFRASINDEFSNI